MTRKTSPAAAAAPWNAAAFAGAGSHQVACTTDCWAAMFRGFEEMRTVQERAAQAAAERHTAAASQLAHASGPGDLLAVQADLLRFDVEGAIRYWQQLWASGFEMQNRVWGSLGRMVDSAPLLEAASALDAATGRAPA
jgi:hypothetical protein